MKNKERVKAMDKDKLFAYILFTTGILTVLMIGWIGKNYYFLPLSAKYASPLHKTFGPSGLWGHGLGIIGSILMLMNFFYSWRKRYEFKEKFGSLKFWLYFHMFVGLLGPALIIYHSAFKFHGIIATTSFFSMVTVVISGIIGRYIYIQVPRTIGGLEITLWELQEEYHKISSTLMEQLQDNEELLKKCNEICAVPTYSGEKKLHILWNLLKNDWQRHKQLKEFFTLLKGKGFSQAYLEEVMGLVKEKIKTHQRIVMWEGTHKLLDGWRFLHKKLSWVLFITMTVHVLVTVLFGFTWVF